MQQIRVYPATGPQVDVWADSPSYADVAAAVATSSPGDVVGVPAGDGTETWASTLTLTRGIHLYGPGRGNLTITVDGIVAISFAPNSTALTNDETIRITGFTFDGSDNTHADGLIAVDGGNYINVWTGLRIGDCRFTNVSATAIYPWGQNRGVIYNNLFDRCRYPIRVQGGDNVNIWTALGGSREFGSLDNLYFEDNTITYSSTPVGSGPGWTETGQCARMVSRYNTWDMTNCDDDEFWDVHGFQDPQTGTLVTEFYGNTLTTVSPQRWVYFRGGWGLCFNNVATGGGSMSINLRDYTGCCDSVSGVPGQIDNCYFWNNAFNGTEQPAVIDGSACGDNPLVELTKVYNLNTAFDGTTEHGVGRGTSVPGVSCTNVPTTDLNDQPIRGDAYWVASTATPTVDKTITQAGRLYKYIGGSWQVYYAPFDYPHPGRTL